MWGFIAVFPSVLYLISGDVWASKRFGWLCSFGTKGQSSVV